MKDLTAAMSRYGYPLATFAPTRLIVNGRMVELTAILWDDEYSAFRGSGNYVRKDGTTGRGPAKPLMFGHEVPDEVRAALAALKANAS